MIYRNSILIYFGFGYVSVLTNWENELKMWGHFAVASYRDSNRAQALHRIKIGMEDILLCGKSMLSQKKLFPPLLAVEWKLIIIDEFHEYKNAKSASYKGLLALRNSSVCPLIGMTGTLMSNAHKELFTLVDLVQPGLLGSWKEFTREYSRPIMLAR
jgi:SNF2 family DNA or RNA helicase